MIRHIIQRKKITLVSLIFLLIPVSISLGWYRASLLDILRVLFMPDNSQLSIIVWDLRLRRVLAAIIIGAILGGSGAAVQASMRNPLASPFTFGLSHAASLGVALALLIIQEGTIQRFQIYIYNPFIISLFAFIFSLIQVLIILVLAYRAGFSAGALVLSSIAISFAYQAALDLLQYLYLNEILVSTIVFWTFGDLGRIAWTELHLIALVSTIIIIPYFIYRSFDYDLILSGDDLASSSGIRPERIRLETTIISALATSFVGVMGFVCLIAPHAARLLVGGGHKYLTPTSMLMGSLILTLSDTVGKTIFAPMIIPVGIMTSMIGVPY
ncbi:MAG: iron ABC transporter permease [Candidatus Bathyarchaeia archaeon]